ncbi:ABC transporter ATP-binding protein [Stutzerimonas zhaodongensis]|uniref:ABC transporter ATP-binding protein n=1 Tax=Stutzerimonas zhaodongensis TaxID=1176257 RepID=UPI0039EFE930
MSSDVAISVSGLAKCFHIYEKPRDRLMQMLTRGQRQYFREFWAMSDVSFNVKKGETVGIVGRNGSGKSTLLQMICGTLNPTHGTIETNGRIAALLELGSGFNPEFSGRENVFLNAAVLGLNRQETERKFPEIEAFAEIGDFIDQPVKTYSSGMMVRLAFAVAINVDPQILIVDEALSVGDELFQRKCFARIEAIKESGATILFVSHSGGTVIDLCDRAILLDGGRKLTEGAPKAVIGKYQRLLYAPAHKVAAIREDIIRGGEQSRAQSEHADPHDGEHTSSRSLPDEIHEYYDPHMQSKSMLAYESHGAVISEPQLHNVAGERVNCLKRGETYTYSFQVEFIKSATAVRFGMMIKTLSGIELGGAVSASGSEDSITYIPAESTIRVAFDFDCNLNPGTYFLNAGVVGAMGDTETYLHRLLDACLFRVLPLSRDTSTGTVDFKCLPVIQRKNRI